jgi:ribokinase
LMRELDVVALNRDEAAAVIGVSPGEAPLEEIVKRTVGRLAGENPGLRISITAGKEGSWSWDGNAVRHVPAIPVQVQGTAGAGDAHLAGIIIGLAEGKEFVEAQRFGTILAAMSVTSPHTIHPGITRDSLREFAESNFKPRL